MMRRWQENDQASDRYNWRDDERDSRHHAPPWGDWGGERYDREVRYPPWADEYGYYGHLRLCGTKSEGSRTEIQEVLLVL